MIFKSKVITDDVRSHSQWNFKGVDNPCIIDMLTYVNQNKRIDNLLSSGEQLDSYRANQCLDDYTHLLCDDSDFSEMEAQNFIRNAINVYNSKHEDKVIHTSSEVKANEKPITKETTVENPVPNTPDKPVDNVTNSADIQ